MVCPDCRREQGIFTTMDRVLVAEGFKIQSGDRILLMAPPNMPADFASKVLSNLKARFTDVEFTMIQGFTGVQIKERDDAAQ